MMGETQAGVSVMVLSFSFFLAIRISIAGLSLVPRAVSTSGKKDVIWRWYNVCVSGAHAFFVGFGCLYCFYEDPYMTDDLEHRHSIFGSLLVTAATGYFLYDALDFLVNVPLRNSWEVLAHHVVVITCFGVVVKTGLYVAYAIVALLVEVNSLFLHTRQLLRMARFPVDTAVYCLLAIVNVVTFVVFRFITIGWMMWWLWVNYETVITPIIVLLVVSMPVMYIINIVLLMQVLAKDVPIVSNFVLKKFKQW